MNNSPRDHEGCRRAFVWSSRAWYAQTANCKNEVMFGMYSDEGGSTGEMAMRWIDLGDRKESPSPQLRAFNDSWSALALFGDLIEKMGELDSKRITEQQFVDLLKECGFEDQTPYESPYEPKETQQRNRLTEIDKERNALNAEAADILAKLGDVDDRQSTVYKHPSDGYPYPRTLADVNVEGREEYGGQNCETRCQIIMLGPHRFLALGTHWVGSSNHNGSFRPKDKHDWEGQGDTVYGAIDEILRVIPAEFVDAMKKSGHAAICEIEQ